MKERKYTLPRHTILASNGSRVGAFIIDLAVFIALSLVSFYACFQFIFKSSISKIENELNIDKFSSGLYIEKDGNYVTPTGEEETSFIKLNERLEYYYFSYLTGDNLKEGAVPNRHYQEKITLENGDQITKSEYYTVSWYNKNILGIVNENPDDPSDSGLFTFDKTDGSYDLNKVGVPKETSSNDYVVEFIQKKYIETIQNDFLQYDYILDLNNKSSLLFTIETVLSLMFGATITYIILPHLLKNGQSLGKKAFGLGLANSDGYKFNDKMLIARLVPFTVVVLSALVPIWSNIFLVILVYFIIFLVSFALSMASPKRMSLHDLVARSIVVDLKVSQIFNNELEEEKFIIEEDGLENNEEDESENE